MKSSKALSRWSKRVVQKYLHQSIKNYATRKGTGILSVVSYPIFRVADRIIKESIMGIPETHRCRTHRTVPDHLGDLQELDEQPKSRSCSASEKRSRW